MSKSKVTDVLTDPEIESHTERILALQEEERQTRIKLGSVIAAIGAELFGRQRSARQAFRQDRVAAVAEDARALLGKDGAELHGGCRAGRKNESAFVFFDTGTHRSVPHRRVTRRYPRRSHAGYITDRPADGPTNCASRDEYPHVGSSARRARGQNGSQKAKTGLNGRGIVGRDSRSVCRGRPADHGPTIQPTDGN